LRRGNVNSGSVFMQVPAGVLQTAIAVARSAHREVMPEDVVVALLGAFPEVSGLGTEARRNLQRELARLTPVKPAQESALSAEMRRAIEAAVRAAQAEGDRAVQPKHILWACVAVLSPEARLRWIEAEATR
jgi:ATP-dependent Clp protease ATP-binding subunit ClpA